jgi:hypothetical protein
MKNIKIALMLIFILEVLILGILFFYYIPKLLFTENIIDDCQIIFICLITFLSSIGLNVKIYRIYENSLYDNDSEM